MFLGLGVCFTSNETEAVPKIAYDDGMNNVGFRF